MSTAAVSSSSIYQELQSFFQNRKSDLQQLGSALQSGDLNGAQQAYSTLAALGQSGPYASAEPFYKSSRDQDFTTIGQDLQTGNLAGAQAAFAALTFKAVPVASSAQANSAQTPAAVVNVSNNLQPAIGTTAPGSTSSIYQQLQAYRQQRAADLNQLGQDLQAGNLNAAQQDFNTLTALGQTGPNQNGLPFQQSDRAQDFQTIGQALQSGNLSLAQSAYASLAGSFGKQDQRAQTAISAYNSGATGLVPAPTTAGSVTSTPLAPISAPSTISAGPNVAEIVINLGDASGTSASNGSATPELVINLGQESGSSSANPSANPVEVTINLGSGNTGTQVSIESAQGQNSAPTEQVINLNQQSNSELILNLLNGNLTSQIQSNSGNTLSTQA